MSDEYKVIAGGEILKINGEFYLGKKIDNRIEELVCISEAIKNKLEVGKVVLVGIKEIETQSVNKQSKNYKTVDVNRIKIDSDYIDIVNRILS